MCVCPVFIVESSFVVSTQGLRLSLSFVPSGSLTHSLAQAGGLAASLRRDGPKNNFFTTGYENLNIKNLWSNEFA